jgi:hypothetical protein
MRPAPSARKRRLPGLQKRADDPGNGDRMTRLKGRAARVAAALAALAALAMSGGAMTKWW